MKRFLGSALAVVMLSGAPAMAANNIFTDVPANHWASSVIQRASENNWIHGMGDGSYAPSKSLTNAEFLTMIANVFFPGETEDVAVPDGSPWYAPCWAIANQHSIHKGTKLQDMSGMKKQISRYDMAQMIINVMSEQNISAQDATQSQLYIQDWDTMPQQYRQAVAEAYALGILNGKNGRFAGEDAMTRAEAAAVLCRMNDTVVSMNASTVTPPSAGTTAPSTGITPSTGTTTPNTVTTPSTENITPNTVTTPSTENTTPNTVTTPSTENTTPNTVTTPSTETTTPNTVTTPSTGTVNPGSNNQNTGTQSPGNTSAQKPDTTGTGTPAPSELSPEEKAAEVVRLVNVEREKAGLAPLDTFDALTESADTRAPELVTLFSHDRPDGTSCFTALDATGANKNAFTSGENIAAGSSTPEGVMEQWMNSPGHKANILNEDFTHIGVGYVKSDEGYRHYWVQMFVGMSAEKEPGTGTVPPTGTVTPGSNNQNTETQSPGNTSAQKPDTTSTETPAPSELSPEEKAAEVVRLVNIEREKAGLAPLGTFDALTESADTRAPELVTLFSHDRPDGTSCFTALDATGANKNAFTYGENIAAGSSTPEGVMEQWMNSPGHKANILNGDFTHIGVGYVESDEGYGHYWVQMFVGIPSGK